MNCCDEYCANYGCNQGRWCPARPAKVGRRTPVDEPLPPGCWRDRLPDLARAVLAVAVCLMLSSLVVFIA